MQIAFSHPKHIGMIEEISMLPKKAVKRNPKPEKKKKKTH